MVSIVDDLRAKAEYARDEANRFRALIADHEARIAEFRVRIDAVELEAVGAEMAANILSGIDLQVDREKGLPRVRFAALDPKP